jgi:hypothetical protein
MMMNSELMQAAFNYNETTNNSKNSPMNKNNYEVSKIRRQVHL